jgi:hypothetical protein
MNGVRAAAVGTAFAVACGACAAESLRCSAGIAAEGDSRLALLYKCGAPLLADSYCAPVYYAGSVNVVPDPFATAYMPCQATEELVYDRGQGNLVATVRLRGGVIRSIEYGRTPR